MRCIRKASFLFVSTALTAPTLAFAPTPATRMATMLSAKPPRSARDNDDSNRSGWMEDLKKSARSSIFALTLATATVVPLSTVPQPAFAADSSAIVSCLFQKCQIPLAKCIANVKCLANVVCINTCNGRNDETGCQIQCGNLFENDVVGEFNKCAISTMSCVPQKTDDGSYPIPPVENLVPSFDTKLFNGRWYITAGQNPLFDIFPCQVHFFEETNKGTFFGKLNWRIEEPDGEFFTRDAVQRFVQDKSQPSLLMNHDNEYLHYQDDWYIVDFEYDNNPDGVPPFCFVYYRGSNDAWDGYGGVVVYTRAARLPEELLPRLRAAAQKVNFDFDKDFTITDNSCPAELSEEEKIVLRERFAGDVVLQTERQLQAAATRLRGNVVDTVAGETKFVAKELKQLEAVTQRLEKKLEEFEKEVIQEAIVLETDLSNAVRKVGFW